MSSSTLHSALHSYTNSEIAYLFFLAVILSLLFIVIRIIFTLPLFYRYSSSSSSPSSQFSPTTTIPTLVVLGSGGHTTEILKLIHQLDRSIYTPIHYCYAKSDTTSILKVQATMTTLLSNESLPSSLSSSSASSSSSSSFYHALPRPREVGQSFLTSIPTTLVTLVSSVALYYSVKPALILVNGPGTCLPLVYVSYLDRVLFGWMKNNAAKQTVVIFVESYARVKSLSLTGKLLYPVVDVFLVHWEELKEKYDKVRFEGRIL